MLKFATAQIIAAQLGDQQRVTKAAHRHVFSYEARPGFLYVRSRAISSRCNDNWDEFPAEEIEKAYRTFVGKPVFINHVNDNHRRARGVIIDAALHHDRNPDGSPDTWAEVLMEVDAVRFPKLARAILAGKVDRTSMGCDVEYSICSACGNRATTPAEYCQHIPNAKGTRFYRRTASGRRVGEYIREKCYGLAFFENSILVEPPADPTAYFLGVDASGLGKAASRTAAGSEGPIPAGLRFEFQHSDPSIPDNHLLTATVPHPHTGEPVKAGYLTWGRSDGIIDMIHTEPEHRRRGIGNAMWLRAHEIANEQGVTPPRHSPVKTNDGYDWSNAADKDVRIPSPGQMSLFDRDGYESKAPEPVPAPEEKPSWKYDAVTHLRDHLIHDHGVDPSHLPEDRSGMDSYDVQYERAEMHDLKHWNDAGHHHDDIPTSPYSYMKRWEQHGHRTSSRRTASDERDPFDDALEPHRREYQEKEHREQRAFDRATGKPTRPMGLPVEHEPGHYLPFGEVRSDGSPVLPAGTPGDDPNAAHQQLEDAVTKSEPFTPLPPSLNSLAGPDDLDDEGNLRPRSSTLLAAPEDIMNDGSLHAVAYGEIKAPQDVDTLREENCPVCGDADTYDGMACNVCGFISPPEQFRDPDLDRAKTMDLRKQVVDPTLIDDNGELQRVPGGEAVPPGGQDPNAVPLQGPDQGNPASVLDDNGLQPSPFGDQALDGTQRGGPGVSDRDGDGMIQPDEIDPEGNVNAQDMMVDPEMGGQAGPRVLPWDARDHTGDKFTPGPDMPDRPDQPEGPGMDLEEMGLADQQPQAVPGQPGDGVPDLLCPSCGFSADATPPQTQDMSGQGGDGVLAGDVCPGCQRAQLLTPGEMEGASSVPPPPAVPGTPRA